MPTQPTKKRCPECDFPGLVERVDSGGVTIGYYCPNCKEKLLVIA